MGQVDLIVILAAVHRRLVEFARSPAMAELVPVPFRDLVTRLYEEVRAQDALWELPRKKWYLPDPSWPDLSVRFHGRSAGNACGPAAGPQTQMAQNLVLSYIAGGRILELKTVQVNDRLQIPRPCIDMANIGYNVEWSQELLVEQSLREYVAGSMLIQILRNDPFFGLGAFSGVAGDAIFDLSVGYDLEGIKSEKVQRFLDGMRDASAEITKLRDEIPAHFKLARQLPFEPHLSGTLTLSTFHGCPAHEIERICEFLIAERDLDVIVKMNPPMLGKERLEHLLHDVLGYTELTVNPSAYTSGLQYDEAVGLVERLKNFAKQRGKGFGCKFSNTLEVLNHKTFFTADNKVQYLSGAPLHVITLTLTDLFRQSIGGDVPISFSAGIDKQNFPAAVACGFVPVTTCSDLLKTGGYARLPAYLESLAAAMKALGAANIDDFILKTAEKTPGPLTKGSGVFNAALRNTTAAAEIARNDPRYRAAANRKTPPRIDSHLRTFDCITCEKCIPVCPNAANFLYPSPVISFEYHDVIVAPDGSMRAGPTQRFSIEKEMQIGNYADFCNECGNCDTFCPEYGGPFIEKPSFHGTLQSFEAAAPRDGFYVSADAPHFIGARLNRSDYSLARVRNSFYFSDMRVQLEISSDHVPVRVRMILTPLQQPHRVDLRIYHTLRHILAGVLDRKHINQINTSIMRA
jgi:putative selenate reductase